MNVIDIILPLSIALIAYLGRNRGIIKQLCTITGVIVGLFAAAHTYSLLAHLTESSLLRTIVLLLIISAVTFLSYDLFNTLGSYLQKRHFFRTFIGTLPDKILSIVSMAVGAFIIFWLFALFFSSSLPSAVQIQIKNSNLLSYTTNSLTPPAIITSINQLLHPFSPPDVFATGEPDFDADTLPATERYAALDKAIAATSTSVGRITTWGCGAIGSGTGFLIRNNLIMTNAHVVAGTSRITVEHNGISYNAQTILFNPKLDVAVLRLSSNLQASPLTPITSPVTPGDSGAIISYPQNSSLTTHDVTILQTIQADGYDIYRTNKITRDIYVVRSNITPGSSGSPLIDPTGKLAGMVVGHATTDQRIGFIIGISHLSPILKSAHNLKQSVSTGSCAES